MYQRAGENEGEVEVPKTLQFHQIMLSHLFGSVPYGRSYDIQQPSDVGTG